MKSLDIEIYGVEAAAMTSPVWDPHQYERHSGHRSRPIADLLSRVPPLPHEKAPRIADLGCGPGGPSLLLAERWPGAHITGYDNSPAMLHEARAHAGKTSAGGTLEFTHADLSTWRPASDERFDLIFSNAALHWVLPPDGNGRAPGTGGAPGHTALFPAWVRALPPGGVFAFQVPGNFDAPSHALLLELRNSPRWRERLGTESRIGSVLDPADYLAELESLGCDTDAWETTYAHLLHGEDAVLDWLMGTGLRPVLTLLADDPEARSAFLDEYGRLLREAYPPLGGDPARGIVMPFRRVFAVAVKR
ncbi:methyltransferase domain-containing protein [Streptomyces winkii]|uniref:methyltransferase domain-containing protein n=1 Tax=Streptomyces winkii TaxID=3051178 RepID=UPI0028D1507A|nr:methyltransferase domain-containing protein [Streptomyces sp. DSM 40971]